MVDNISFREKFEQERDVKVKFMHPKGHQDFMAGHSEMTFALYQITVYLILSTSQQHQGLPVIIQLLKSHILKKIGTIYK